MSNDVAFLTTIFPMEERYLLDFFGSLKKQTVKNFDVVVVNDGYKDFSSIRKQFDFLNIIELDYSSTPAKNREYGINYVNNKGYDILIFGDSDDCFSENRIQVCLELLNSCEIVVNDLSLFDDGGTYSENYFSHRVNNGESIAIEMVKDKNLFGLSNTAIRLDILDSVSFDDDLIAVDWYLFSKLLLEGNRAVFTNETLTFYRQYSGNTVGMNNVTKEYFMKGVEVKLLQYKLLCDQGWDYVNSFNEISDLKKMVQGKDQLMRHVTSLREDEIKFPFWWEGIRLLRNNHEVN